MEEAEEFEIQAQNLDDACDKQWRTRVEQSIVSRYSAKNKCTWVSVDVEQLHNQYQNKKENVMSNALRNRRLEHIPNSIFVVRGLSSCRGYRDQSGVARACGIRKKKLEK